MPTGGDDSPTINAAIQACTADHYVLLGPGTFIANSGITFGSTINVMPKTNVTLRGSGPLLTKIVFTGSTGCGGYFPDICINNDTQIGAGNAKIYPGGSNSANWIAGTTGYAKGITSITLDHTGATNLAAQMAGNPGTYVLILDQPNDEAPLVLSPNGAYETGNTVTINTTIPHGFNVGEDVFIDNVGGFAIQSPALSGMTESGTTATIVTSVAHPFVVGNTVCISGGSAAYDGSHTITAVTPPYQFSFEMASGAPSGGWGNVDPCYSNAGTNQTAYRITSVPTPTSFTFTHPLANLAASGRNASGYTASAAVVRPGMMVCQTGQACRAKDGGSGTEGRFYKGMYRSQTQMVKVVSMSGDVVTFTPEIYASNWGDHGKSLTNCGLPEVGTGYVECTSPGVYWTGRQTVGVGIEDMTLDHSGSVNGYVGQHGIKFQNAYDCWMKNVRSIYANVSHALMYQSSHITLTGNYFYGINHAVHTGSYGIDDNVTSNNLFTNNIFQHIGSPVVLGVSNSVILAHNFSTDQYYTMANWLAPGAFMHDAGDQFVLYEGNDFAGITADYIHGTHALNTFYRNRFVGPDVNLYNGVSYKQSTLGTEPITIQGRGRFFNVIGNVMGTTGFHTAHESSILTDPTLPRRLLVNKSIYSLGWGTSQADCTAMVCDPDVSSTMMRWGNYDTVSAGMTNTSTMIDGVRWNSTEVPHGDTYYPNAVPATHTLPASLFLASQPAYWTMVSPAPPEITTSSLPDVTPGVAYSTTLAATGGTAPYTWANLVGALPVGLSLDSSTGVISGTTTAAQETTLEIQVVDAAGRPDRVSLPLTVLSAPAVLTITSTSPLPAGVQGSPYSATIAATGGPTPYAWAVTVGTLPEGLDLDAATGIISGTPTGVGVASFTIRVTDHVSATDTQVYSLTIAPPPPLVITTTVTLPSGQVGVPYIAQLIGSGGTPPCAWSISGGVLPSGYILNSDTGVIRGVATSSGVAPITVDMKDSSGGSVKADLTLTVLDLPSGIQGGWSGIIGPGVWALGGHLKTGQ
jgi:hypothetical protein